MPEQRSFLGKKALGGGDYRLAMQSQDSAYTGGDDDTLRSVDGGERSTPPRPLSAADAQSVGGQRADMLDRMFDEVAAEDAELLERLAR